MSWKGLEGWTDASHQMKLFGKPIGEAMADQVARDMPDTSTLQHASHRLEYLMFIECVDRSSSDKARVTLRNCSLPTLLCL